MSLQFVFLTIFLGFLFGQILRYTLPSRIELIRDIAVYTSLRIAIPISIIGSIWALKIESGALILLPIVGAGVLLSGLLLGIIISYLQKLTPIQRGVVGPSAAYTNIGGVGAFVVFSFLGEEGFALVPLYKLFEELIYFGILFPFAARHSQEKSIVSRKWWQDSVIQIMLMSLVIGFGLNISGIYRPEFVSNILDYTIPFGAFSMMLGTGIIFQFNNLAKNVDTALPIALLKPIVLFIVAMVLIYVLGIQNQANHKLMIGVCIILAIMPTAFLASIPASIYKLDIDLANTIWVISTGLFFIMLPFIPSIVQYTINILHY